jgi:hypothetical protein
VRVSCGVVGAQSVAGPGWRAMRMTHRGRCPLYKPQRSPGALRKDTGVRSEYGVGLGWWVVHAWSMMAHYGPWGCYSPPSCLDIGLWVITGAER